MAEYRARLFIMLLVCFFVQAIKAQDTTNQQLFLFKKYPFLKSGVIAELNRDGMPPASMKDSLSFSKLKPEVANKFNHFVQQQFGTASAKQVSGLLKGAGPAAYSNQVVESKLRAFMSLKDGVIPTLSVNQSSIDKLQAINETNYQPVADFIFPSVTNNTYLTGNTTLLGISVNVIGNYSYAAGGGIGAYDNFHLKVQFDKDAYLKNLRSKMNSAYSMDKFFLQDIHIESLANDYVKNELAAQYSKLGQLPDGVKKIIGDSTRFTTALQFDSAQLMAYLKDQKIEMSGSERDTFIHRFTAIKNNLAAKGFDVNHFIRYQQALKGNITSLLNKPNIASELSENVLPLSGIQRFFLQLKQFKIGSFSPDINKNLASSTSLATGFNMGFEKKLRQLNVTAGSMQSSSVFRDVPSSQVLGASVTQFFSASIATLKGGTVSVAQSFKKDIGDQVPVLPKNTVAFTLSQEFSMGKLGSLTADVSKSSTQYNNSVEGDMEHRLQSKNAINYIGEDFWQTIAVALKHNLDIADAGFSAETNIRMAGLGYQHPLSNGLYGGRWKIGTKMKKAFLKRKLQLNLRLDARDMTYGLSDMPKMVNVGWQLDGRYRYSKTWAFTMRWYNNQTDQHQHGISQNLNAIQKIETGVNINYRIAGLQAMTNATMGFQQMRLQDILPIKSNAFTMSMSDAIVIKRSVLSATTYLNKELSSQKIIGDLLNADINIQYPITKTLSLNNAVVYLNNGSVAHQLGIRQGIQLNLGNQFDCMGYVDVRKDLIENIYPGLYSNCRGNFSIRYTFK
ncbi:MAG: hypothetical protein J0I41_00475 [Filimonas sp.]|nr:hypothetical protein [Filimonas sp.]